MERCPNCNQPILPDDTTCWQCGTKLSSAGSAAKPVENDDSDRDAWIHDEDPSAPGQSLPGAPLVYTAVTVGLIALSLLLLALLGRRPLVQVAFRDLVPTGYETVTTAEENYTFYLPRDWFGLDAVVAPQATAARLAAAPDVWADALLPLGAYADEWKIFYTAVNTTTLDADTPPTILVVARSSRLADTSLEAAERLLNSDEEPAVLRLNEIVYNADRTHLAVRIATGSTPLRRSNSLMNCRQHFLPGGHLAAVCAPAGAVGRDLQLYTSQQETILNSFEALCNPRARAQPCPQPPQPPDE